MTLSVEQGRTIRLPAEFFSEEDPADPTDPLVDVLDPSGVAVVTKAVPDRDSVGAYHYDYAVPSDAPLGTWRASWTATIDGKQVGGEDSFEVIEPTTVPISAETDHLEAPAAGDLAEPDKGGSKARSRGRRVGLLLLGGVLLGAIVLAVTRLPREPEPVSTQEALKQGLAAQTAGKLEEARERYEEALEADPENQYAHFNLGVIEQRSGNTAEAKKRYQRALASDRNFVPAIFNLAIAHETSQENERAAQLYRRIIALDPSHSAAHLNLGFLLMRKLGRRAEGEAELRKAIELNPSLASRVPASLRPGAPPSPAPPPP